MPNDTLPAHSGAVPDTAHPDDSIFVAIDAVEAANAAVSRLATIADEIVAKAEGRTVTESDRAAEEAAHSAYYAAVERLGAMAPATPAGVAAMVIALAKVDEPEDGWLSAALQRLAACPALADRV